MNEQLKTFIPLCESIGKLFYPNVEVVLHDLDSRTVAHIVNSFSKRVAGDVMISDPRDLSNVPDIIGPYSKVNIDGTKLKTVSTILRDMEQNAIGIICINFKAEVFENMYESLKVLLNIEEENQPKTLFSQDWKVQTHNIINTYLSENNLILEKLKTKEKKDLILHLNSEGVFSIRNVIPYLCKALDVSRAAIYKWLKEVK
jgi:predicted transcriptional regulator YheO